MNMIISATEFQQNVGHYLQLVEQGEELIVQRKKPNPIAFQISIQHNTSFKQHREKTLHDKLKKYIGKIKFDIPETGIEFQNRVRD